MISRRETEPGVSRSGVLGGPRSDGLQEISPRQSKKVRLIIICLAGPTCSVFYLTVPRFPVFSLSKLRGSILYIPAAHWSEYSMSDPKNAGSSERGKVSRLLSMLMSKGGERAADPDGRAHASQRGVWL